MEKPCIYAVFGSLGDFSREVHIKLRAALSDNFCQIRRPHTFRDLSKVKIKKNEKILQKC